MSSHLEKSLLFSLLPRFDKVCVPFAAVLYWYRCPSPNWHQRGGERHESSLICNFLVTVGANVVSYYICKWLDSYRKGK